MSPLGESVQIVLPTYNELASIGLLVRRTLSLLPAAKILVVDDSSPDGTAKEVEALCEVFPQLSLLVRPSKDGLGKAYSVGLRRVLSQEAPDSIVMMDADHSHDPRHLPQMLSELSTCDLVVGSRYVIGGRTDGWEPWRAALSRCGNAYCRLITGVPIRDLTSGFNAIRGSVLRSVDLDKLTSSGYAFQVELKYELFRHGAVVREVPITFQRRLGGESKLTNFVVAEGVLAPWKLLMSRGRIAPAPARRHPPPA